MKNSKVHNFTRLVQGLKIFSFFHLRYTLYHIITHCNQYSCDGCLQYQIYDKNKFKKSKKKKKISSSTLANCIYFYWTFDTSCMIRKVIRFSPKASVMYCWNFYEKCSCLGFLTLTCSYLKSLL